MRNSAISIGRRIALLALLVSLIGSVLPVTPVHADGIVVNSNADTDADDGFCTLREAIISAVSDIPSGSKPGECVAGSTGVDSISFADNYIITLHDHLPYVTTEMKITGNGAGNTIIQAATRPKLATWRVFQVTPTGNLTLDQVTVRNGNCIEACAAVVGEEFSSGAGIYNSGILTVSNSVISGNSASWGAGIWNYSGGSLSIINSTISDNMAYVAAGISNWENATATVINSTFSGNHAEGEAGALYNEGALTITNSTISDNIASQGGGISISTGVVTITNSTISRNMSTREDGAGGGIYNDGAQTILRNTIIANNSNDNCYYGTFVNEGNNLDSGTSCGWGSDKGSMSNTDPKLGPLADNGGTTKTILLLPGSPAINAGNDAMCPATDQRGVNRPQGSYCDIGAYERDIPLRTGWMGGATLSSDRKIVVVGRPHIGNEVASYDGFASGSLTAYVPMLFKKAYGSYNSALYVQNLDANNYAYITIKYYDSTGFLNCTRKDLLGRSGSEGYWVPDVNCDTGSLPDGWIGGAVVTSDRPIVAVGRPHVGNEVMAYDGFSEGSMTSYIPMLFNGAYGGTYNAAFYIQNVHESNPANIMIKYYDSSGNLNCTKVDTISPLASKGYWLPSTTCDSGSLPSGWVGGVVVTSDQPVVSIGRPHIGTQVTTYGGFTAGGLSSYIPMLFKGAFGGSYNSAFYLQNANPSNTASITIKYYSSTGELSCTQNDTIAPLASKGYWVPSTVCDTGSLPVGWVGGVIVSSNQPIVGIGRPHISAQVTTYNGLLSGSLNSYLPMLFKDAYDGSYDSAFYIQNTENNSAAVTVRFYESFGYLICSHTYNVPALSTKGIWVPDVSCDPN